MTSDKIVNLQNGFYTAFIDQTYRSNLAYRPQFIYNDNKKGQKVYIGICLKKFAAFAVCHEPISKRRFVIMSLMPMLLGIIPLAIFLLSPPNAFLSGICIPMGIIGMLSPMPDYMDVHIICKQVPKGAFVHTQNDGFYWYK